MTTTTVVQFTIQFKQILNQDGDLVDSLPKFAQNSAELIKLYSNMVLTRLFDAKAIALQRTGKLGTYPSTLGQEAISCATASAMQEEDVLCPYYRDNAAMIWRGVKLEEILLYWGGSEIGSNYADSRVKQDFPICIPISSQNLHAAGIGLAIKLRKQKRAVVVSCGDGATSRGDFYEAINFAGVHKLPIVFVINNNQYAISVPLSMQTAAQTLAQKSIAAGIPNQQVDGNDIIVMREAMDKALQQAYAGSGPSIIEAITYRLCDHTTSDDARRYRNEEEVNTARLKDPIVRLRSYLEKNKLWDSTKEQKLISELNNQVTVAVDTYLATPKQPATSMFDYLYATLPSVLSIQRQMVE